MKLYELTEQYRALADATDIPDEALADTLEGLEGEIEIKAENLLAVVTNMGADVDALDKEIKRLQARKKAIENRQQSLRDYLKYNMCESGISKITCPLFTITLGKGRDVAVIENQSQIPDEYVKVERKTDKAAILRDLKKGLPVPGARLGKSDESLLIR